MIHSNPKSNAWDQVGGLFWKIGRKSARPSNNEISIFLSCIKSREKCMIIGASTKNLIQKAIDSDIKVTIVDFSDVMCQDLKKELVKGKFEYSIFTHDVLEKFPSVLLDSQSYVISDRLINRFTKDETRIFFKNILEVLKPKGQLRTSVKMGFYEMDKALLSEGKKTGNLYRFFDESSNTFDFSKASKELSSCLLPHGKIPRNILLKWYNERGKESRYSVDEIINLITTTLNDKKKYQLIDTILFPDAPNTIHFVANVLDK